MVAAKSSSLLIVFFLLGFAKVNCESNESNLGSNESDIGSNESYVGSNERILDDAPKTRISGGTNANKQYSFVPLIVSSFTNKDGKPDSTRCNGAYIHFGSILTSARCLRLSPGTIAPNKIEVHFEKIFRDKELGGSTSKLIFEFDPTNAVLNPGFDYETRKDDLAIIKIDKNIKLPFVKPIKIRKKYKIEDLNSLYVAGWGKTPLLDPTRLQFGKVSTIPKAECTAPTNPDNIFLENKICSKGPTRLCEGDDGSPLVFTKSTKRDNKPLDLIGIGSLSTKCGAADTKPDVYVEVSKYYDWIKSESKNKRR